MKGLVDGCYQTKVGIIAAVFKLAFMGLFCRVFNQMQLHQPM